MKNKIADTFSARVRTIIPDILKDTLFKNAYFLLTDSAFNVILGLVIWFTMVRLYSSEIVGVSTAAISAILLLVSIVNYGLGAGLIRFLPESKDRESYLVNMCLTITFALVSIELILFYIALPVFSSTLYEFLHGQYLFFSLFVFGYLAMTIYDQTVIGAQKSKLLIGKNLLYNGIRLVLLAFLILALNESYGIFFSFGLSALFIVVIQLLFLMPKIYPRYCPAVIHNVGPAKEMLGYSIKTGIGDVLFGLPILVAPILIVEIIDARNAAYYSVTWMIISSMMLISRSATLSLFIEGSHNAAELVPIVRKSIRFTLVNLVPAIVVIALLGRFILDIFGTEYSVNGYPLLIVFLVLLIPFTINTLYFTILRVEKRLKELIYYAIGLCSAVIIVSYYLLHQYGLLGVGLGWIVPHSICCVYIIGKLRRYVGKIRDDTSSSVSVFR